MDTTITIRTDKQLKAEASALFESLGMNLSTAVNIFFRQAIIQRRYPCIIECEQPSDARSTYPPDFFLLFGSAPEINMEEPADIPAIPEEIEL